MALSFGLRYQIPCPVFRVVFAQSKSSGLRGSSITSRRGLLFLFFSLLQSASPIVADRSDVTLQLFAEKIPALDLPPTHLDSFRHFAQFLP